MTVLTWIGLFSATSISLIKWLKIIRWTLMPYWRPTYTVSENSGKHLEIHFGVLQYDIVSLEGPRCNSCCFSRNYIMMTPDPFAQDTKNDCIDLLTRIRDTCHNYFTKPIHKDLKVTQMQKCINLLIVSPMYYHINAFHESTCL